MIITQEEFNAREEQYLKDVDAHNAIFSKAIRNPDFLAGFGYFDMNAAVLKKERATLLGLLGAPADIDRCDAVNTHPLIWESVQSLTSTPIINLL